MGNWRKDAKRSGDNRRKIDVSDPSPGDSSQKAEAEVRLNQELQDCIPDEAERFRWLVRTRTADGEKNMSQLLDEKRFDEIIEMLRSEFGRQSA